jgi:hypothetical protein
MFDSPLAADNPNLRAVRDAGGKIITWQALADQLIFTGDSINFYNRALGAVGGFNRTEQFFRFFLAPGVTHCGVPGEKSIAPTDPMSAVVKWVETGQAPDVLDASGTINGQPVTRPLRPYPAPDAVYAAATPTRPAATAAGTASGSRIRSNPVPQATAIPVRAPGRAHRTASFGGGRRL